MRAFRIRSLDSIDPTNVTSSLFPAKYWSFNSIKAILVSCRRTRSIRDGESLHSLLIKNGSRRDVFLANNLMSLYAEVGFSRDARKVFDDIVERNVVSWTTVISSYVNNGESEEALDMFTQMLNHGEEMPNVYTLSAALKACSVIASLELGRWIHHLILRLEIQWDAVLINAVLDMYVNCGSLTEAWSLFDGILTTNSTTWNIMIAGYVEHGDMVDAERLFDRMPNADVVTYNTIIAGFAQKGSVKALEYMHKMHLENIKLDLFTIPCSLKICGCLGFVCMGKLIHNIVIKYGLELDPLVGSALIDMYAKCNALDESRKIYSLYSVFGDYVLDMVAVSNSMISAYVNNGHNHHAINFLNQLHGSGVVLDTFSLSSALKSCSNSQNLRFGIQIHSLVVVYGYRLNHIVGSILTDMYLKCGCFEKAFMIFSSLPHKDVVTWAGIISGCVQYRLNHLAFSLFRDMISLNIEVDHFVLSSILKCCSSGTWNCCGIQVHGYIIKKGFEMESAMTTSLIDMYSKYGEIDSGLVVFSTATKRDTLSWTAVIGGCGQNGRANEAIEYFQEMLKSGAQPNEVTFLGVLSACRHAGLVEDACSFFNAMREKHNLIPSLEHYCCMVDILGRSGLTKEAWELIISMPLKPDETVWSSFLAACGINDIVNIHKLVKDCLHSSATYDSSMLVTLSNTYASLGIWDNSIKLREIIRIIGSKEPGMSWLRS